MRVIITTGIHYTTIITGPISQPLRVKVFAWLGGEVVNELSPA